MPASLAPRTLRWLAGSLLLAAAFGVACGGDGGDGGADATSRPTGQATAGPTQEQPPSETADATTSADVAAIEALVRQQTDAFNARDVNGFVASFSDSYYEALGVTREDAAALVSIFIGVPQVEITAITAVTIAGDGATAEVASAEGVISSLEQYTVVRQDGTWLVAAIDELPVETDAALVELSMFEYGYDFDAEQFSGDAAFDVSNNGTQPHEIELMRLPDGVSADDVRDRENVPAGVEVVGLFGPLEPGENRKLVFAGGLPAGDYALVCYLTTVTGESNAQLGMVSSLVVP